MANVFDEDAIPPAIRILLEEPVLAGHRPEDLMRSFRRLIPELRAQAEWTIGNFAYFDKTTTTNDEFVAVASGGLDPLSPASCTDPGCRVRNSENVARTLGLYADVVLLTDHITNQLAFDWEDSDEHRMTLISQLVGLRTLSPMIRSGVIRFWPGRLAVCRGCKTHLDRMVKQAVRELLGSTAIKAKIGRHGMLTIDVSELAGTSLLFFKKLTRADKNKLKAGIRPAALAKATYPQIAQRFIHSTLLDLKGAEDAGASLFSTSRQSLLALHSLDVTSLALDTVHAWESARSVTLPWVDSLSVRQVIELRQEASSALPAFRETFVRRVAMTNESSAVIGETIQVLREEAASVNSELINVTTTRDRAFRGTYGILAMAAAIYGVAAGQPAVALGGLLTALGFLHQTTKGDHDKLAIAKSKPAYVLMKAHQLARHATKHR